MSTTRDGDDYVDEIRDIIEQSLGSSVSVKKSKSSGSLHGDGDLVLFVDESLHIMIDGKYRGRPSQDKDLVKAVRQAVRTGRSMGIVVRNSSAPSGIVRHKVEMSLRDLVRLLQMISNR